jgi:tRNA(Ile)-lysidine synthase
MSACANKTRPAPPRLGAAVSLLGQFLGGVFPTSPPRLGVAFSGGADSTALLLAARDWARIPGASIAALHVDHGLDSGSRERAERAEQIARGAGVAWSTTRIRVARGRRESWEEAARRQRYQALAGLGERCRTQAVMTAHHLDDQIETLVIRLRQGSGLLGLAGIRPQIGVFLRPFLALRHRDLLAIVQEAGIEPLRDPANDNLDWVRNLVRHRILPRLAQEAAQLEVLLAGVSAAARTALPVLERLGARQDLAPSPHTEIGRLVLRQRLRAAGRPDPGRGALRELARQVALGRPAPCASARGAQLIGAAGAMPTRHGRRRRTSSRAFSYSVTVPGAVDLPALGQRLEISRSDWQPWMIEGRRDRAAFCLEREGAGAIVRSRLPGDRILPLGGPGTRRLKEVLIDRKVPVLERDGLPLLCIGGKIAWVPGVTVHDDFRLRPGAPIWVASLRPIGTQELTTGEEEP